MEKVYRKEGKKYISCGYSSTPDISDGIWLVQSSPGAKSMSSLIWKVGDLNRPTDITTHAAMQSIEGDLARYLLKLCDENSEEFNEAKEICGAWISSPIGYHNISASQLCSLFLRRISIHLEAGETMNWDSLQHKFREETKLYEKPEFHEGVKVLYMFTEWLKSNNIKFRQGKNIG